MPAQFTPAVPVRTYERIVEQVESAITSGALKPGDHLPSERELMAQFSVSRPTVREALRALQVMGLVESKAGSRGGPLVLEPSPELLTRSLTTLTHMDSLGLTELVQFRMMLEATACRLAALGRTEAQLAAMRAAVARMADAVGTDAATFVEADLQFHQAVWDAAGNTLLAMCGRAVGDAIRETITDELSSADTAALEADSARRDAEVCDAIAAGDPVRAGLLMRAAFIERYTPLVPDSSAFDALAE